ncbi:MAG: flagellar protein FlaG [Roseburia sp.]|nr:flagellar protein FlaG [Roseburia sp.]MCM1278427.1 flagellar protein FlaG [Robinsoniella sp.]
MAIEPLGSAMTLQAQPIQKTEAVKPVTGRTESAVQEVSQAADAATLNIKAAEGKENSNGENGAKEQGQPSKEQLRQAVEKINKNMGNSEVLFGIHEATNRITIKVVNKDTKEVLRELPPEKTLDMIAKVWELAGILVDERR